MFMIFSLYLDATSGECVAAIIIGSILFTSVSFAAEREVFTFRCKGGFVKRGMMQKELVKKCSNLNQLNVYHHRTNLK